MSGTPELQLGKDVIVHRDELYDPNAREYVRKTLPTRTVKWVGRRAGTVDVNTALGSVKVADGSVLLVTRLSYYSDIRAEFAIHDKNGTHSTYMTPVEMSGTAGAAAIAAEAKAQPVVLLGSQEKPVMVLVGSAYKCAARMIGSFASGTFVCSVEGVKDQEYIGKRG